jgi:3-phenylpropionate/trans-cinnamate dioxygenase ferredoxin reductase component
MILIVGAGQAGAQAAISLRQGGHAGAITIAGEEPDLPYERPPLSKDYLAGSRDAARLLLRPAAFWAERAITIETATRITAIDAGGRTATAADGRVFGWETLIWAAGGHARPLPAPGADLPGVHAIGSRADVDALRGDMAAARAVLIIGGGYVGLESAAVLAGAGKAVTVCEAQPRLLARVAGAAVGDYYAAVHRGHGVDIRLATGVSALHAGADGRVAAATLSTGETLPADLVIVGIGLLPATAALAAAGAATADGITVDGHGRSTLPGIYAIGDCANAPCRFHPVGRCRIESVANAVESARAAAGHIIAGDRAPVQDAVPWFWSNQYDLRLQTVGLSAGHDATVVRGDPAGGTWSLIYLRSGAVVALDCINAPRDYVQGKALVDHGAIVPEALLADATQPLKTLMQKEAA